MFLPKQHFLAPSKVSSFAYSGTRDIKKSYEIILKVKMENNYHFTGADVMLNLSVKEARIGIPYSLSVCNEKLFGVCQLHCVKP